MKQRIGYIYRNSLKKHCCAFAALCLVLSVFLPVTSYANGDPEEPEYDEISIFMNVQGVGSIEIPAVISNEIAYMAVADVFNFLKIKNTLSPRLDSITGFFIDPDARFFIDYANRKITYKEKMYDLRSGGLIRTESNLYLRSDLWGKIFELECTFSFRNLAVVLNTRLELPVVRELRQEVMRRNVSRLKGQMKADTIIERSYPSFKIGMADWSLINSQNSDEGNNTRFNISLGGIFAGGEANVSLNYHNNTPFAEKQQWYQWRFVDNDLAALRQVRIGKLIPQTTSSLFAPVVGIQLTNTPTTFRKSFGTYRVSNFTEPNWMVELYVNNVLVNYIKADASGFYAFDVPLVYGNSFVQLRFYGPNGEERVREENINIPFNFLPLHEFEYTITAGVVEDSLHSMLIRANVNYGMGRKLTVGGGVEYLSSVRNGEKMPFVNASFRPVSNLLLTAEYTYGVRAKGTMNYRLPSNVQFEANYIRYKKKQQAINNTFLEERRIAMSFPIRGHRYSAFTRLSAYQIVLPSSKIKASDISTLKYTNLEGLFSVMLGAISTNFTTYATFTGSADPFVYSNLSMAFRLPSKIVLTPQAEYQYMTSRFISLRGELGKYVGNNGFLNVFYEKNFRSNFESIGVGIRYDLSFMQVGASGRLNNKNKTSFVQTARGSLLYDGKTNWMGTTNRTSIGKAGLVVVAFIDLNGNGKREMNEPKVQGLKLKINGGRIIRDVRDTLIRVLDLEPYAAYFIELDANGFQNIFWRIKKQTMSVSMDPNQFKYIEVPVMVAGEAEGMVYVADGEKQEGLGRITVCFYNKDSALVGKTLTENDGFFNFSGLPPGAYSVRIDPNQLQHLNLVSSPEVLRFNINYGIEGDVAEGLDFVLSRKTVVSGALNK